ncbi:MAG: hypothetical protein ACLSH5_06650 [Christensenellales bacterium]
MDIPSFSFLFRRKEKQKEAKRKESQGEIKRRKSGEKRRGNKKGAVKPFIISNSYSLQHVPYALSWLA